MHTLMVAIFLGLRSGLGWGSTGAGSGTAADAARASGNELSGGASLARTPQLLVKNDPAFYLEGE